MLGLMNICLTLEWFILCIQTTNLPPKLPWVRVLSRHFPYINFETLQVDLYEHIPAHLKKLQGAEKSGVILGSTSGNLCYTYLLMMHLITNNFQKNIQICCYFCKRRFNRRKWLPMIFQGKSVQIKILSKNMTYGLMLKKIYHQNWLYYFSVYSSPTRSMYFCNPW